ncbi:MAG: response regulator [Bacteroidia bacterium]|nr:response regulator [Bacteroidia bacterium]
MNSISTLKRKIILVEDDEFDAEIMMMQLEKTLNANEEVKWISQGEKFLEYISDQEKVSQVGVVFLDLRMPKLSGIEILKALSAKLHKRSFPVVVFSSSRVREDIDTCYKLGANSFVTKPGDSLEFNETVSQMGNYWFNINQIPAS